jgi:hypothetical protein
MYGDAKGGNQKEIQRSRAEKNYINNHYANARCYYIPPRRRKGKSNSVEGQGQSNSARTYSQVSHNNVIYHDAS